MLLLQRRGSALLLVLTAAILGGCGGSKQSESASAAPPPPQVVVEVVKPQRVVVKTELPGRVQAFRTAEVRARVEGIIQKRLFTEGSEVKAGDLLFQIDPSTLKVNLDVAKAKEARAEADLTQAQLKQKRFKNLLTKKAVSQQDYDEALALQKQAEADVAAAKATVAQARIDLDYASVRAPITGRIGRALVTEGALVGKNEATHLATIEQLDPLYVNFTQSANDIIKYRREHMNSDEDLAEPEVRVLLEDGSVYPQPGKLLFSEMTVDPGTGEVLLRAEVPNPNRELLPGMFVRVDVDQAVYKQAFTISQRSLIRSAKGEMVMTVLPDGKVVPLPIKTGQAYGDRWIVTKGLSGGEQVIVEGLQKVRPGMTAVAVPLEQNTETPANDTPKTGA